MVKNWEIGGLYSWHGDAAVAVVSAQSEGKSPGQFHSRLPFECQHSPPVDINQNT